VFNIRLNKLVKALMIVLRLVNDSALAYNIHGQMGRPSTTRHWHGESRHGGSRHDGAWWLVSFSAAVLASQPRHDIVGY
jgi:hypothetical protein